MIWTIQQKNKAIENIVNDTPGIVRARRIMMAFSIFIHAFGYVFMVASLVSLVLGYWNNIPSTYLTDHLADHFYLLHCYIPLLIFVFMHIGMAWYLYLIGSEEVASAIFIHRTIKNYCVLFLMKYGTFLAMIVINTYVFGRYVKGETMFIYGCLLVPQFLILTLYFLVGKICSHHKYESKKYCSEAILIKRMESLMVYLKLLWDFFLATTLIIYFICLYYINPDIFEPKIQLLVNSIVTMLPFHIVNVGMLYHLSPRSKDFIITTYFKINSEPQIKLICEMFCVAVFFWTTQYIIDHNRIISSVCGVMMASSSYILYQQLPAEVECEDIGFCVNILLLIFRTIQQVLRKMKKRENIEKSSNFPNI